MKIQATTNIEVTLTPQQEKEIFIRYLYDKFDWGTRYYISNEDDCVYVNEPCYGHCVTYEPKKIRNATDTDYAVAQLLLSLRSL